MHYGKSQGGSDGCVDGIAAGPEKLDARVCSGGFSRGYCASLPCRAWRVGRPEATRKEGEDGKCEPQEAQGSGYR